MADNGFIKDYYKKELMNESSEKKEDSNDASFLYENAGNGHSGDKIASKVKSDIKDFIKPTGSTSDSTPQLSVSDSISPFSSVKGLGTERTGSTFLGIKSTKSSVIKNPNIKGKNVGVGITGLKKNPVAKETKKTIKKSTKKAIKKLLKKVKKLVKKTVNKVAKETEKMADEQLKNLEKTSQQSGNGVVAAVGTVFATAGKFIVKAGKAARKTASAADTAIETTTEAAGKTIKSVGKANEFRKMLQNMDVTSVAVNGITTFINLIVKIIFKIIMIIITIILKLVMALIMACPAVLLLLLCFIVILLAVNSSDSSSGKTNTSSTSPYYTVEATSPYYTESTLDYTTGISDDWICVNQCDYEYVGMGNGATIKSSGCALSCLASVLINYTGDTSITPETVVNFAKDNGYYSEDKVLLLTDDLCRDMATKYNIEFEVKGRTSSNITAALYTGKCAIVKLTHESKYTDGTYVTGLNDDGSTKTHFIILLEYVSDGIIACMNPNGGEINYIAEETIINDSGSGNLRIFTDPNYEGSSTTGEAVASYALQFVGNPYVWGGTSLTNGADCSGFVLSVYAHFGYTLPHSSSSQANCGTEVSLSELQPGDLLFYGTNGSIGHVAIYIGNGQIVHASSAKTGIKTSVYNYRDPVKATRIIDE